MLAILVVLAIALMTWQPPRPNVVVVKPQQSGNATQPAAVTQPQPAYPYCQGIFVSIGPVQACGAQLEVSRDPRGYVITLKNGWVSGPVILLYAPACPVKAEMGRLVIPCDVTVLVVNQPITAS